MRTSLHTACIGKDTRCPLDPLGAACIAVDVPSDLVNPPSVGHTIHMEPSPDGASCAH